MIKMFAPIRAALVQQRAIQNIVVRFAKNLWKPERRQSPVIVVTPDAEATSLKLQSKKNKGLVRHGRVSLLFKPFFCER